MAFQANIDRVNQLEDAVEIIVTYTDGKAKIRDNPYRFTSFSKAAFDALLRAKIDALGGVTDTQSLPPLGPYDPKVTPPTQGDLDRTAYALKISTVRQMERAIALEIKTVGDSDYVAMKKAIKDDFKDNTYLDLI